MRFRAGSLRLVPWGLILGLVWAADLWTLLTEWPKRRSWPLLLFACWQSYKLTEDVYA